MQKFKLINKQTGEEHLCDKVEIDGFDYYVSNEFIEEGNFAINLNTKEIRQYDGVKGMDSYWKKVIATSNPNIDCPKVVDEVEKVGSVAIQNSKKFSNSSETDYTIGFIHGYNKSQETHPFSEEDIKWFFTKAIEISPSAESHTKMISDEEYRHFVLDELYSNAMKCWKSQQLKTIYFKN